MMTVIRGTAWCGAIVVMFIGLYAPAFADAAVAQPALARNATLPPPPPALARVWILRQYEPSESLATPMIYVNGAPLAVSYPGTIFYRDFPPGTYTFSVDSCGTDTNQDQTLRLGPGSHSELEIQSLGSFKPPYCGPRETTSYVRPVLPRFLQLDLPQLRYLGAR
jgi:hypothetical protein